MSDKRVNLVNLFVGGRGTGKSTKLRKVVEVFAKKGIKVLIIETFPSPAWKEFPVINAEQLKKIKNDSSGTFLVVDEPDKIFAVLNKKVYNALVICEDATKYIGSKLTPDQKALVVDSKQKNIDLVFVFHAWGGQVPPDLIRLSDTATLFKTNEIASKLNKIPNPDVIKAHERVVAHESQYYNETVRIGG